MLLKKLFVHSLIISLAVNSSLASAQMRGHSTEQVPVLIIPQEGPIFASPHKINRVQINSVQWNHSGEPDKYEVYPDLSFDFIRKYHFRIIPAFKVGNKKTELPDGYYYLRAAMLKPKLGSEIETFSEITDQYITGTERIVRADGGIISSAISFTFPSLPTTTFKNRLLMEIIPLKQESIKTRKHLGRDVVDMKASKFIVNTQFDPMALAIPFAPMQNADSVSTVDKTLASDVTYDEDYDISAIMAEGLRKLNNRINETKFLNPQKWATKNKVSVTYNDQLFQKYEAFSDRKEVCKQINDNINYKIEKLKGSTVEIRARVALRNFCENEKNSFSFKKVNFIHPSSAMTILNNGQSRSGGTTQLVVSLLNGNNTSRAFDQYESTTLTISPLDMVSKYVKLPGLSVSRSYTMNEVYSNSAYQGGALSQSALLEVRRVSLAVQASNTRTCYLLKLNQSHSALKKDKISQQYLEDSFGKLKEWGGQLVCRTQRQATTINEDYFHVVPAMVGQGISDGMDPRNQIVNISMRGLQDFNLFTYQIRNSLENKYRAKVLPSDVLTSYVAAETVPGTHFVNYEMDNSKPNFIERNFFDPKDLREN